MKHLLATILVIATICLEISGQRSRTTRTGNLRPATAEAVARQVSVTDTVCVDSIVIANYDKPLRSLRETFFVTNRYSDTITAISLQLLYNTVDGQMLHRRRANAACDIPPGETRQLYIVAWDRQYTYYHESTRIRPKSPRATPYRVTITPIAVSFRR